MTLFFVAFLGGLLDWIIYDQSRKAGFDRSTALSLALIVAAVSCWILYVALNGTGHRP